MDVALNVIQIEQIEHLTKINIYVRNFSWLVFVFKYCAAIWKYIQPPTVYGGVAERRYKNASWEWVICQCQSKNYLKNVLWKELNVSDPSDPTIHQ